MKYRRGIQKTALSIGKPSSPELKGTLRPDKINFPSGFRKVSVDNYAQTQPDDFIKVKRISGEQMRFEKLLAKTKLTMRQAKELDLLQAKYKPDKIKIPEKILPTKIDLSLVGDDLISIETTQQPRQVLFMQTVSPLKTVSTTLSLVAVEVGKVKKTEREILLEQIMPVYDWDVKAISITKSLSLTQSLSLTKSITKQDVVSLTESLVKTKTKQDQLLVLAQSSLADNSTLKLDRIMQPQKPTVRQTKQIDHRKFDPFRPKDVKPRQDDFVPYIPIDERFNDEPIPPLIPLSSYSEGKKRVSNKLKLKDNIKGVLGVRPKYDLISKLQLEIKTGKPAPKLKADIKTQKEFFKVIRSNVGGWRFPKANNKNNKKTKSNKLTKLLMS